MFEAISDITSQIEKILRYIAPGFIGISLLYVCQVKDVPPIIWESKWMVTGCGILLGVVLNAIHVAFLEDFFCWFVVAFYKWTNLRKLRLPFRFLNTPGALIIKHTQSRVQRSTGGDPLKFHQWHDQLGAALTFLYCSSYSAIIIWVMPRVANNLNPLWIFYPFFLSALLCDLKYVIIDDWGMRSFTRKSK